MPEGEGEPVGVEKASYLDHPWATRCWTPDGSVVFTTTEEFLAGEMFNVNANDVPDELRLNAELSTYPVHLDRQQQRGHDFQVRYADRQRVGTVPDWTGIGR